MNDTIKQILDDIYKLDPELKKHEPELIKIVDNLLKTRPETEFNDDFVKALRADIMAKASSLKERPVTLRFWQFPKLSYFFGGAILGVALVIAAVSYFDRPGSIALRSVSDDVRPRIDRLASGAFGSLAGLESDGAKSASVPGESGTLSSRQNLAAPTAEQEMATEDSASFYGTDADMGAAKIAPEMAPLGMGGGGGLDARSMIVPPYEWTNYKYEYTGEALTAPAAELPVYKRRIDPKAIGDLTGLLSGGGTPYLDLNKFRNLRMTSLSASEDRDYGYTLYFDFLNGMANVDMQWEKWPQPGRDCRDQACFDGLRLKAEDVPADQELIRIADSFLGEYGIDKSDFGPGEARNEWRTMYGAAEIKSDIWIPDTVTVVYPLKIKGQTVYEESGYTTGLNVSVNIREKRVSNMYGLKTLNFESSDYAMETDTDLIRRLAERGGNWWGPGIMDSGKTVTVKLGAPKVELISYWRYDQKSGRGEELYIPAYIFPILNKEDAPNLYRDNIVVPLVREIIDEQEKRWQENPPMPLIEPMLKEGAVDGSGGGETAESTISEPLMMGIPEIDAPEAATREKAE
ncbi:MAG: hypothetical protein V1867_07065 [Candidatus Falkowbacteria bacterium]